MPHVRNGCKMRRNLQDGEKGRVFSQITAHARLSIILYFSVLNPGIFRHFIERSYIKNVRPCRVKSPVSFSSFICSRNISLYYMRAWVLFFSSSALHGYPCFHGIRRFFTCPRESGFQHLGESSVRTHSFASRKNICIFLLL
jgi:hypothetical protein